MESQLCKELGAYHHLAANEKQEEVEKRKKKKEPTHPEFSTSACRSPALIQMSSASTELRDEEIKR